MCVLFIFVKDMGIFGARYLNLLSGIIINHLFFHGTESFTGEHENEAI
jgi:hypothetical protein